MERERRLRAFVLVERRTAEAVAATPGCEVVQRFVELVASEEPLECACRTDAVLAGARECEGGQFRLDDRGRVERLLVAAAGHGVASPPATVARETHRSVPDPRFVPQPPQRVEPDLGQLVSTERLAAADEGLR